jgi:hypothetical protein
VHIEAHLLIRGLGLPPPLLSLIVQWSHSPSPPTATTATATNSYQSGFRRLEVENGLYKLNVIVDGLC